jgi:hypothetical protein
MEVRVAHAALALAELLESTVGRGRVIWVAMGSGCLTRHSL